jgi:hypothetical protein
MRSTVMALGGQKEEFTRKSPAAEEEEEEEEEFTQIVVQKHSSKIANTLPKALDAHLAAAAKKKKKNCGLL